VRIRRTSARDDVVEVMDRVLDKGIVVDAWGLVSLMGLQLLTFDTHMVIASIDTYLNYGSDLPGSEWRGRLEGGGHTVDDTVR
jgi:hypothetical protein